MFRKKIYNETSRMLNKSLCYKFTFRLNRTDSVCLFPLLNLFSFFVHNRRSSGETERKRYFHLGVKMKSQFSLVSSSFYVETNPLIFLILSAIFYRSPRNFVQILFCFQSNEMNLCDYIINTLKEICYF